jgi:hypothetical protein
VPLKLVRVDDRLIHGQVVAVWLRAVGADRIVIVDDKTAQNEFLRDVLVLAAPQGTPVEVYGLTEGAARVAELASSPTSAFLLMRTPRHRAPAARVGRAVRHVECRRSRGRPRPPPALQEHLSDGRRDWPPCARWRKWARRLNCGSWPTTTASRSRPSTSGDDRGPRQAVRMRALGEHRPGSLGV